MKQSKFIKKQAKKFDYIHNKKFKKILEIYDKLTGSSANQDLWQVSTDIVNDKITKMRPIYKNLEHQLKCAKINADGDAEQIDALRDQCCQAEAEKTVLMAHCDMLEKQLKQAENALEYKQLKQLDNAEFVSQIVDNLVKNNE